MTRPFSRVPHFVALAVLALLIGSVPYGVEAGAGAYGTTTGSQLRSVGVTQIPEQASIPPASDVQYDYADAPAVDPSTSTWTYTVPDDLAYSWNRWVTGTLTLPSSDTKIQGWVDGLSQPAITINFNYSVSDHTTHASVAKNSTVTVGQKLDFTFAPYGSHDISWFGTGYSMDSPYGEWRANAAAPPRVGSNVVCNSDDYVVTYYSPNTTPPIKYDVYIPLVVNPPTRTFTPGANLGSCTALVTNPDTSMTETCTVTGTGSLSPSFNYGSTYGYFYYRYYDYRDMGPSNGGPGCYGNNIAMKDYGPPPVTGQPQWDGVTTIASPYKLTVPSKPASYPLTAAPASNQPPSTPTFSTCPATATVGSVTFALSGAVDPDGDQIRYGLDSTKSGTVTTWVPTPGYLASGAPSGNFTLSTSTPGMWTVKALAADINGNQSTWVTCTVNVSNPLPDLKPTGSTGASTSGPLKPISFSGTVLNNGAGAATSFPNVFQIDDSSGTTRLANVAANTVASLAPSATAPISASYATGLAVGSYSVRLCVNMDTSGASGISETDPSNNCGSFVPFTVSAPLPPTVSCSVAPASGYQGDTFTWTAIAAGGTGAPYTYAWTGPGGLTGKTGASVGRVYSSAGVYGGSVIAKDNSSTPSASTACTAAPSANVSACTPTLSPSNQTIDKGQAATFTLGANGTHCGYAPATCTFTDGSAYSNTVYPSSTSNYAVTCPGTYGSATGPPVVVTVRTPDAQIQANGQTGSTRVSPSTPNNVTLTWSSSNVVSCTITANGSTVSSALNSTPPGLTQSATTQTVYKIDCINAGGTHATDQVVVNVASTFQEF